MYARTCSRWPIRTSTKGLSGLDWRYPHRLPPAPSDRFLLATLVGDRDLGSLVAEFERVGADAGGLRHGLAVAGDVIEEGPTAQQEHLLLGAGGEHVEAVESV